MAFWRSPSGGQSDARPPSGTRPARSECQAVLREDLTESFDLNHDSPYMLLVAPVKGNRRLALADDEQCRQGLEQLKVVRSDIPAVTQVDHSARIQMIDSDINPTFHRLLTAFKRISARGVLVNTRFNVRDEPIVCTPEDAYRCFMATEMDALVLGNVILFKSEQ